MTTQLCAETSRLQGLGGLAAAALGRALTCTLLVADGAEPEETFQVSMPACCRMHACSYAACVALVPPTMCDDTMMTRAAMCVTPWPPNPKPNLNPNPIP